MKANYLRLRYSGDLKTRNIHKSWILGTPATVQEIAMRSNHGKRRVGHRPAKFKQQGTQAGEHMAVHSPIFSYKE
jgi:hypothetical protein